MGDVWQQLLHRGVFLCAVCKKIPTMPIWVSPEETNLCNKCYESEIHKYDRSMRNTSLMQVIEMLSFPCEYSEKGCREVVEYSSYHEHVSDCPYTQTCLMDECDWAGYRQDLVRHICNDHTNSVIQESNGMFPIICEEEMLDTINVIQTTGGEFIARIIRNLVMLRIIIYSKDQIGCDMGEFVLEYPAGPSSVMSVKCNVSTDVHSLTSADTPYATEIEFLRRLETPVVNLTYKPNDIKAIIPKQISSYFICCDCGNFITTTTWECKQGHQVCDLCASKPGHRCSDDELYKQNMLIKLVEAPSIKCSNCYKRQGPLYEKVTKGYMCKICFEYFGSPKIEVKTTRLSRELMSEFQFPCRFEEMGCKFVGPVPRIHEWECDYRLLRCPATDCHYRSIFPNLLRHMKTNHSDVCTEGTKLSVNMNLNSVCKMKFFLFCYNILFIHTLRSVSSDSRAVEWNVTKMSGNSNKDFLFTTIINGNYTERLIVTQSCGIPLMLNVHTLDILARLNQKVQYSVAITRNDSTYD